MIIARVDNFAGSIYVHLIKFFSNIVTNIDLGNKIVMENDSETLIRVLKTKVE